MGAIPTIHEVTEPGSVWAVWVKTDFDQNYVDVLKESIPPRMRKWDPDVGGSTERMQAINAAVELIEAAQVEVFAT